MTVDLWISIALAIPLGIATNIVTPKFQRWLERRFSTSRQRKSAKRAKQRAKQLELLEKEFNDVSLLHRDPGRLTNHYLDALLWIAFISAFGTLYASIIGLFSEVGGGTIAKLAIQGITLLTGYMVLTTASKAIRTARRVRNFEVYSEKTQAQISDLAAATLEDHRTTP